jgi:hypothetical protein
VRGQFGVFDRIGPTVSRAAFPKTSARRAALAARASVRNTMQAAIPETRGNLMQRHEAVLLARAA